MKKFYVTTPIYYVNDIPHIGHAYTTIMADVIKRFKELQGYQVFFLTGTDEHGQKIEKSAMKKNISPKKLADAVVLRFKELWETLDINYDKFIRTTDEYHQAGVKKIFKKLQEQGDIYPGKYQGHYCISDESYVSDTAEDTEDKNKICPDCGKKTERVTENCYFFRLSAYQQKLLHFYQENPNFVVPNSRMNEVLSFVKMGLKDLCITRSTVKWGVSVPGDEKQTIYVWLDALTNYLTGINYLHEDEIFTRYWPADLHIMAKDILKFHAVYWPAFLLAVGIKPPKQELIHGWWLKDEKKMSKSTGNVLDPHILLKFFSADAIRYFLMREAPIGADGNFSHQGFITRINTDLANDWGNLISRTTGMIEKYFHNEFDSPAVYGKQEDVLKKQYEDLEKEVITLFNNYHYNKGLKKIFEYINLLNRYIVEVEPWKLAKSKDQQDKLAGILKTLVRAILSINTLLSPVLPETSKKITEIFDYPECTLGWKEIGEKFKIGKMGQLFPRVKINDFFADEINTKEKKMEEEKAIEEQGLITIEDFKKVKMVVALIDNVEKIEGADKLLKLTADTGTDKRILIAGIAQYYKAEDLIHKKVLIVKNLKPAKIRGILSQGMILAASDSSRRPYIPILPDETPVGAILE